MTNTFKQRKENLGPLLEKFRRGDALSDAELYDLLQFYRRLEQDLTIVGDQFFLAWKEARMRLMVLESFRQERKWWGER